MSFTLLYHVLSYFLPFQYKRMQTNASKWKKMRAQSHTNIPLQIHSTAIVKFRHNSAQYHIWKFGNFRFANRAHNCEWEAGPQNPEPRNTIPILLKLANSFNSKKGAQSCCFDVNAPYSDMSTV